MVRMDDGSYQTITTTAFYVTHLNRILISPQGIDTQEGDPVIFGVYVRRKQVNPYCKLEVQTKYEG